MSEWANLFAAANDTTRSAGRWRTHRTMGSGTPRTMFEGREVVNFASNDYLGLSQHPSVVAAAHEALDRYGSGSGASRLVVGGRQIHDELEAALAAHHGTADAVVLPTGFAANLAALGAAVSASGPTETLVCSDELNHASIIDGARLSRAEIEVTPHLDLDALRDALAGRRARHAIVVTDLVFSMDGDSADASALHRMCESQGALLILDVAHAVFGESHGLAGRDDVMIVGTLSKTLGSLGGYICGTRDMIDRVINAARSHIFTTAPTPAQCASALAALDVVEGVEGDALRHRLRERIALVDPTATSPIVPVVIGSEADTVALSDRLLDNGFLVPAIRPPTVPAGSSRLRVTLSAAHDLPDVQRLCQILAEARRDPGHDAPRTAAQRRSRGA